jgi:Ser-tRNA(Ala) deacylase AlaX
MTHSLFLEDAYRTEAPGRVVGLTDHGVVLDASLFFAASGGQPGDTGVLEWPGGDVEVVDARKGEGGTIVLALGDGPRPHVGTEVLQRIDWARRHAHMRCHTGLHLLSVVLPFPVTGGAIGVGKGRLDFDMAEPPQDLAAVEAALNALVAADHPVAAAWVKEAVLDAEPDLVKTLSVRPPRGAGQVRLVRIGAGEPPVDLQPCGGTHVLRTGEVGRLALGKLEKKGRQNRRVSITLS